VILGKFKEFLPRAQMAKWHVQYLYVLARRAAASVVRGDMQRFLASGMLGAKVAGSLGRNYFGSGQ
jgi:hypothetical protein